jgi:hypothetical protein
MLEQPENLDGAHGIVGKAGVSDVITSAAPDSVLLSGCVRALAPICLRIS